MSYAQVGMDEYLGLFLSSLLFEDKLRDSFCLIVLQHDVTLFDDLFGLELSDLVVLVIEAGDSSRKLYMHFCFASRLTTSMDLL